MADWLVILITAAVFLGIILLAIFAWKHRAGRLARAVSGAGDRYNHYVGMGGAPEIPPQTAQIRNPGGAIDTGSTDGDHA